MIARIVDQHILVIIYVRISERAQKNAFSFDLNAALNRIEEMHAAMAPMEDTVFIKFLVVSPDEHLG